MRHIAAALPPLPALLFLFLFSVGPNVALAMGGGGAGHGAGIAHGSVRPSNGGGSYDVPPERRAHVRATPRPLLQKRIQSPRS
jgi:hypothetical protein